MTWQQNERCRQDNWFWAGCRYIIGGRIVWRYWRYLTYYKIGNFRLLIEIKGKRWDIIELVPIRKWVIRMGAISTQLSAKTPWIQCLCWLLTAGSSRQKSCISGWAGVGNSMRGKLKSPFGTIPYKTSWNHGRFCFTTPTFILPDNAPLTPSIKCRFDPLMTSTAWQT